MYVNPFSNIYTQTQAQASTQNAMMFTGAQPYGETKPVEQKGIEGVSAGGINGRHYTGGTPAGSVFAQKEIEEVGKIGAAKKTGFENGLGGTNNPDNHRLFLVA